MRGRDIAVKARSQAPASHHRRHTRRIIARRDTPNSMCSPGLPTYTSRSNAVSTPTISSSHFARTKSIPSPLSCVSCCLLDVLTEIHKYRIPHGETLVRLLYRVAQRLAPNLLPVVTMLVSVDTKRPRHRPCTHCPSFSNGRWVNSRLHHGPPYRSEASATYAHGRPSPPFGHLLAFISASLRNTSLDHRSCIERCSMLTRTQSLAVGI